MLYADASTSFPNDSEVGVVYGNKVEPDTGLPSQRLKARLDAALTLYNQGLIKRILVSGGIGSEGFDEAKVMAQYLRQSGVPDSKLLVDSQGNTSSQTSKNAIRLLSKETRVVAISQQFHISRCKLSLRNAGFTQVSGYYPDYYEPRDIYSTVREVPAWVKYWIKGL